jgi:hypothetical protein
MFRGEQAARTDISQAFNSCDSVCLAGISVSRDSKADCSFDKNSVDEYSGKSVSQVGDESG